MVTRPQDVPRVSTKQLITAGPASKLLGVSKPTLYRLVANGAVPPGCYVKAAGSELLFKVSAIEAWLADAEGKNPAGESAAGASR